MNSFFILAAGFGKRMGFWTESTPKPLLKIDGVRFLDYTLYLLKKWGFQKGIINVHYHSEKIINHISNFKDMEIYVSEEKDKILGTGGGIKTGISRYPSHSPQFLINPDMLYFPREDFLPISRLPQGSLCHLYLLPNPESYNYTGLSLVDNHVVFGKGSLFYIGLSLLDPIALIDLTPNKYYDLSDLFKELAGKGALTGEIFPGKVLDLGDQKFYEHWMNQSIFNEEKNSLLSFLEFNGLKA